MSFADIELKIAGSAKAQDGKLSLEDLTGGTFSSPTAACSAR